MRSFHGGLIAIGLLAACGGGSGDPDPLISGSMTGSYAGDAFTPNAGFATIYMETPLIGVGDGNINCDSPNQNDPPSGLSAGFAVPDLAVGDYTDVFVQLFDNRGDFQLVGTGGGSVSITAASETSVAGMVSWSFTDTDSSMYSLSGTFEVVRCN